MAPPPGANQNRSGKKNWLTQFNNNSFTFTFPLIYLQALWFGCNKTQKKTTTTKPHSSFHQWALMGSSRAAPLHQEQLSQRLWRLMQQPNRDDNTMLPFDIVLSKLYWFLLLKLPPETRLKAAGGSLERSKERSTPLWLPTRLQSLKLFFFNVLTLKIRQVVLFFVVVVFLMEI